MDAQLWIPRVLAQAKLLGLSLSAARRRRNAAAERPALGVDRARELLGVIDRVGAPVIVLAVPITELQSQRVDRGMPVAVEAQFAGKCPHGAGQDRFDSLPRPDFRAQAINLGGQCLAPPAQPAGWINLAKRKLP